MLRHDSPDLRRRGGGVLLGQGGASPPPRLAAILRSTRLARDDDEALIPYINVDPGTMSPFQHGEVYVTDDGAETDLDLGHYERFVRTRSTGKNSDHDGQDLRVGDQQGAPRRLSRARPCR